MGVPPNRPSHYIRPWLSIETHVDFGILSFQKPPYKVAGA